MSCRYIQGNLRYLDTEGKSFADRKEDCVYEESASTGKKGDTVGEAQYLLDGKVIAKRMIACEIRKKAGLWDYIKHIRKRMIKGDDYSADR